MYPVDIKICSLHIEKGILICAKQESCLKFWISIFATPIFYKIICYETLHSSLREFLLGENFSQHDILLVKWFVPEQLVTTMNFKQAF